MSVKPSQTAREELIDELGKLVKKDSNSVITHKLSYTMKRWELELVADFIIEDRKRIVEPIVKYKKDSIRMFGKEIWGTGSDASMDQTLKNAGVSL